MPVEKKHFAFTFMNNGQQEEQFADVEIRGEVRNCVQVMAETVVRNSSVRTSRKYPQPIIVKATEIMLDKGQPVRAKVPLNFEIMPYQQELDAETYVKELDEILKKLPVEFHDFIKNQIHDKSSMEEGIQTALNLTNDLVGPIRLYGERIKKSLR